MRGTGSGGRPYFLLSLVYICVHLTHIALSCVLLLNGWTPMSVRERAELADISALGVVINSWKGMDTREDDTYSAEFRLLRVYKGHDFLGNVTSGVSLDNAVYNISNFGSKAQCYADVEVGSRYFLFLTLYEGRLSGQYDDLFGAASGFNEDTERGILDYLDVDGLYNSKVANDDEEDDDDNGDGRSGGGSNDDAGSSDNTDSTAPAADPGARAEREVPIQSSRQDCIDGVVMDRWMDEMMDFGRERRWWNPGS
ncbi:von Willebrand factor D and EGF domain-containing protein [Elysia marginata]|uniref:von Willebrand factor D and EGF domain-containing protein n=1 Tax=Elysia marginata TaxID=1093978 RepID=A0AAV4EMN4_9GAST|nr:von Willebrand factor D and EGF domain-containing protein [Elysia marginata]